MLTLARQHPQLRTSNHLDRIYDGLRTEYRHYIWRNDFKTFDELIGMTDEFEVLNNEERPHTSYMIADTQYTRSNRWWRCKAVGHTRRSCRNRGKIFCSYCGRDGTLSRETKENFRVHAIHLSRLTYKLKTFSKKTFMCKPAQIFIYVMIAHHSSYVKIYKKHWIAAMIIFCWVFSYGMQLPTLVGAWGTFGYDQKLGTCSILPDIHGHSSKTTLFIAAFLIPCLIIIACYTKIFWVVHKSEQRLKRHANKQNSIPNNLRTTPVTPSNVETGNGQCRVSSADSSSFSTDVKQESVQKQQTTRIKDQREVRAKRNEWRITKMVLAIFLSFLICYLPITIAKVADKDVDHPNLHILSYIMLYMSACINPIIYVIMNKQYRKAYKTVIMCRPSRLLPFGKHAAGGNNSGSSAAEKWKDTGLNHNHSHTMVSVVDQQNTSFSSSVQSPAMELTLKTGIRANDNNTNSRELAPDASLHVPAPTVSSSTENAIETKMTEQLAVPTTSEQMPILAQSSKNNNNQVNNGMPMNSAFPQTSRPNNRIALVGGDIILEEEEEEEEGKDTKETVQSEMEQTIMAPLTPPPPPPQIIAAPRPTPVYVNASVLHQKKNPSYGQNINVIPDNKNSTKLLTKTKL